MTQRNELKLSQVWFLYISLDSYKVWMHLLTLHRRCNNNNNGILYCAGIHQVWRSWRMNIITPVIGPVISFQEPSQLPGEYAAHAAKCVAQQASLPSQVPIYTPGWREAITVKCLAQDTSTTVTAIIQTHILTTRPSEHKSDALNRTAMAPQFKLKNTSTCHI